jgi:class 3 adenylate cyclase/tetratricopeptide (TPR) repeat protein
LGRISARLIGSRAGLAERKIPAMTCRGCGTENRPGRRFCAECGAPLDVRCSVCGASNEASDKFCGECGQSLVDQTSPPPAAVAERRLVSVLFADLVGFTALSEHWDPEEVRELLSGYFDRCRTLIERYGGTVEKFIGDAVMAVWGSPVAREDDAERAVRAGLALTQAVRDLSQQLQLRVGILTGNAAVDRGAEGEGMVLGDTVNTASRLQSIARPGSVLVDDVTRRASEAAIAYEDAGNHDVKGRDQPVRAWTALRVVAGAGGARRSAGLEAPFVGRQRELEMIVEAGEQSARKGCARRVAVVGEAGTGKSRLVWEFFKYLDGIEETRWWHQGRCLSYGEGVAYWALAEMVRTRAGISEDEAPRAAREKLRAAVAEHVPDERERRLVEPRLAHLLRLDERPDADRADLFSGWRLFFERMADTNPVILVFEDLQWADGGLLDFVDYLLEWSAEFPIYVLALGRPELRARRAAWEALPLMPLAPGAIRDMLDGLAPGLPIDLVEEIGHRSEGIPLYAVETIRMLQDRGLLVQEGARYVVTGDVSDLEVPETLQALVASRLDGLSAAERALLQNASVLGHSFTGAAVAALSDRPEGDVAGVLDGLVTKQVLARDDDPRSPERGQYVFIQALLRTVAYGTLSRRTRKTLHRAAASYLERAWPGEAADIAEVLASHYLEAIRADPGAEDAGTLRALARERLTAAGRAAASLALGPEAQKYFEQAAQLAEDDLERAAMFEQAGRALQASGDSEAAERQLRQAVHLYRQAGVTSGASAAVRLAEMLRSNGQLELARELLEPFRARDDPTIDEIVRAEALGGLGATLVFAGALDEAGPLLDEALTTLEERHAWPALASVLVTRGVYLVLRHRFVEGLAVLRLAVSLADEHDLPAVGLRGRYNLASVAIESDRFVEAVREVDDALALARERGDRQWERMLLAQSVAPLTVLGQWDEATAAGLALIREGGGFNAVAAAGFLVQIAAARADLQTLERCCSIAAAARDSPHVDMASTAALVLSRAASERGHAEEALALARPVLDATSTASETIEDAYAVCIESALALGNEAAVDELAGFVAELPPGRATPMLRAGRNRLQAVQADRRGDTDAAERFEAEAIELLRSVGATPLLAKLLLERARRRDDPAALSEATSIFEKLKAVHWLERIDQRSQVTV